MNATRRQKGFTLIELLVAVMITAGLAAMMLMVTTGTLDVWGRTQDSFAAESQARLVLDHVQRDLQAAIHHDDGSAWLAADIFNAAQSLTNHGWLTTSGMMKPAGSISRRYDGTVSNGVVERSNARFGLSGVWLRLLTTNSETNGSLPAAVAYQIARRPVSGPLTATDPTAARYTLFRSAVAADSTFAVGNNVLAPGYASTSVNPSVQRGPTTLMNPNTASDVIATNVVDFGVWLYTRDSAGELVRVFPANGRASHVANSTFTSPVVADVMIRILTEEGARRIEAMETGVNITRPAMLATDAEWWWSVVEANSHVMSRRIQFKAAAL
jgi:prepilin-type N-terminal cleavage/methylation domain-containing protein